MVVVLVVIARTDTPALAAKAVFRENMQAANMAHIVADRGDPVGCAPAPPVGGAGVADYASALTTASPISAVPTLVVPSLQMSGVRRP